MDDTDPPVRKQFLRVSELQALVELGNKFNTGVMGTDDNQHAVLVQHLILSHLGQTNLRCIK